MKLLSIKTRNSIRHRIEREVPDGPRCSTTYLILVMPGAHMARTSDLHLFLFCAFFTNSPQLNSIWFETPNRTRGPRGPRCSTRVRFIEVLKNDGIKSFKLSNRIYNYVKWSALRSIFLIPCKSDHWKIGNNDGYGDQTKLNLKTKLVLGPLTNRVEINLRFWFGQKFGNLFRVTVRAKRM